MAICRVLRKNGSAFVILPCINFACGAYEQPPTNYSNIGRCCLQRAYEPPPCPGILRPADGWAVCENNLFIKRLLLAPSTIQSRLFDSATLSHVDAIAGKCQTSHTQNQWADGAPQPPKQPPTHDQMPLTGKRERV